MPVFLALDQGTTSSRALVFDADGNELAKAQLEFAQHFPRPGWVEHDAAEILATQEAALQRAWAQAGSPSIAGVGITNQRETIVLWERASGQPLQRAIVWQDRRTARELEALRARGLAPRVLELAGLPLDPYFSAAKIAWLLDQVPGARKRAERGELCIGTIDTWLVFRLTRGEVFATEPSNASRTSLYALASGDWSDELCELFRVPRACLPEIRDSAGDFGQIAGRGWPIRGVLGDQQAALFGQGCLAPGEAKCTYGTGAFLLANSGTTPPAPRHGLLATVAWRIGGQDTFALEGSVLVAGALVQWLRDGLGIVTRSGEIEALARTVPDSGGVVLVPAFAGLGTPHWDADARGLLIGLTRGTTRAQIARAGIEAIALSVTDVVEALAATLGAPPPELRVDGGAAANDLLLEVQATLLATPVVRPANLETTALGAMRIAALGSGAPVWAPGGAGPVGASTRFMPQAALCDRLRLRRIWAAAVQRAKGWASLL